MDPLSTTASLIAVLQVANAVIKIVTQTSGAKSQRDQLRQEIKTCRDVLEQLQENNEDPDAGDGWSTTLATLEAKDGPLARLAALFSMIETKLRPRSKLGTAIAILGWPFEEKHVLDLVYAINREKQTLHLALSHDSHILIRRIDATATETLEELKSLQERIQGAQKTADDNIKALKRRTSGVHFTQNQMLSSMEAAEERKSASGMQKNLQKAIDEIRAFNHTTAHNESIQKRQPDTGLWLLDSPEFRAWESSRKQKLFCPGIPGAGKSVMCSAVVEHLVEKYIDDPSVAVCYIYCDYRRIEQQTMYQVLSSLLSQLLQQCSGEVLQPALSIYEELQWKRRLPTQIHLHSALSSVMLLFDRIFLVVDALDECQESGRFRQNLIAQIHSFVEEDGVNVLATSRPILDIIKNFTGTPRVEIRASEGDINQLIDSDAIGLPPWVHSTTGLMDEIRNSIIGAADGMFLLAQLYLKSLEGRSTKNSLRKVLATFRGGNDAYKTIYDEYMSRITSQSSEQSDVALNALLWVTHSKEPFDVETLQHALATNSEATEVDEGDMPSIEFIITACAGLIAFNENTKAVSLVHYTTQEYLERTSGRWHPDPHSRITSTCLQYLSYDQFTNMKRLDRTSVWRDAADREITLSQFYKYAARYWHLHLREAKDFDHNLALNFLRKEGNVPPTLDSSLCQLDGWDDDYEPHPLLVAAFLGLRAVLELPGILEFDDVNYAPAGSKSALQLAIISRHWGMTAAQKAHLATEYLAVIRLLLDRGADVNATSPSGHAIALGMACAKTQYEESLVCMLLDFGAKINPAEYIPKGTEWAAIMTDWIPLLACIEKGDMKRFRLLLDKGADVENDIDVGCPSDDLWSPLAFATMENEPEMVKELLDRGAKVAPSIGMAPLQVCDDLDIAKMLISAGANPNTGIMGVESERWMHWAFRESPEMMSHIMQKVRRDKFGMTPLGWAILLEDEEMVKTLLSHGAEVNESGDLAVSPLTMALNRGLWLIARHLLLKGADLRVAAKEFGYGDYLDPNAVWREREVSIHHNCMTPKEPRAPTQTDLDLSRWNWSGHRATGWFLGEEDAEQDEDESRDGDHHEGQSEEAPEKPITDEYEKMFRLGGAMRTYTAAYSLQRNWQLRRRWSLGSMTVQQEVESRFVVNTNVGIWLSEKRSEQIVISDKEAESTDRGKLETEQ